MRKAILVLLISIYCHPAMARDPIDTSDNPTRGSYFTMGLGVDLLLGFLPMPLFEAGFNLGDFRIRAGLGSLLLYGKAYAEIAYVITNNNTAIYIDSGGFYAGYVGGHFYEAGLEFGDTGGWSSGLRFGVAVLNVDTSDPWNGAEPDTTVIFPRIGFIARF